MWLSVTAQTALRAVLHIAQHGSAGPLRADDIAAELQAPRNYLSKTLHALARAGVLRSTRGPRGGFELMHAPEGTTLIQVVSPFAPAGERRCLVGRATCGDANPCPAHHCWASVAANVERFFERTTVADLVPGGMSVPLIPPL